MGTCFNCVKAVKFDNSEERCGVSGNLIFTNNEGKSTTCWLDYVPTYKRALLELKKYQERVKELETQVKELEDHVLAHHIVEDQARDRAKD